MRLQLKAVLAITGLLIATTIALSLGSVHFMRSALRGEVDRKGVHLADYMAHAAEYAVFVRDVKGLEELIRPYRQERKEPDLVHLSFEDAGGAVLASLDPAGEAGDQGAPAGPGERAEFAADVALQTARHLEDTGDPRARPGTWIGRARVVMSYARADAEAAESNRAVAGMALPVALAGILLTLGLTRRTVKPLEELALGLEGVAQGLPVPDIRVRGSDEVAQLGLAFNRMHGDLRAHREEVRRINANLETLVQKRTQDLARANRELVAASRTKSEFLASMSHELRTPLNAILGFMSLVIEGHCANPAEEKDLLRDAQQGARHLLTIINSILDLAKIETGKMTLQLEPLPVAEVLDAVRALMRAQAELKGIDLQFEPPAAGLPRVFADPGKLKQILVNLVGNAIKFTDQGSVSVRAAAGEGGDGVRFEIRDTGIGIPVDKHHLLFQKFQQLDSSTTRRHGGTGLGLTICKALVEMMGGGIWLHSPGEGRGTTVSFTVPGRMKQGAGGEPPARSRAQSGGASAAAAAEDVDAVPAGGGKR